MKPFVILACVAILLQAGVRPASAIDPATITLPKTLRIGDQAPDIDVADWVHPGTQRQLQPLTRFQPGTIYVIEFWATWCPHSREAIPLLAGLQKKLGRDVAILAVGVDQPEELRGFLADDDPDVRDLATQAGTFCIVADPDGSVYESFMAPFMETELPTAFIVGRSGLVEWVGHPLEIEEPLSKIVDGSWDRQAFGTELVRRQAPKRTVDKALRLFGAGSADEAVAVLDAFTKDTETSPAALNELAWTLVLQSMYGRLPEPILDAAQRAAAQCVAQEPTNGNALDTLAHVLAVRGRLDEAIATQRKAVEHGGADADTFRTYLRQLEAGKR
jgi:thiol-disulfide isomerase/thioredoxin